MQPQNLSLTSSHARCTTTTFSWDDIPDRGTGAKRCRVFHSMHATKVASECYISKFLDYEPANPLYQTLKDQKKSQTLRESDHSLLCWPAADSPTARLFASTPLEALLTISRGTTGCLHIQAAPSTTSVSPAACHRLSSLV